MKQSLLSNGSKDRHDRGVGKNLVKQNPESTNTKVMTHAGEGFLVFRRRQQMGGLGRRRQ